MISKLDGMKEIAKITLQHHERYDGSGYPERSTGKDMHPLAKILAVADSYDAMTQDRPYKSGMSTPMAIEEIKRCKGNHFDPTVAEIFISSLTAHTGDSYIVI